MDGDAAASGRGAQVIKVVMPTFIMAPTEDERCGLAPLPATSSQPLTCSHRFRRKKVCRIISECLARELEGKEFDEGECKGWATAIADAVRARVGAECHFPRYKVLVQAFVGQQRLQDVRITSRCLWDNDNDNHASADFHSVRVAFLAGIVVSWFNILIIVTSSSTSGPPASYSGSTPTNARARTANGGLRSFTFII